LFSHASSKRRGPGSGTAINASDSFLYAVTGSLGRWPYIVAKLRIGNPAMGACQVTGIHVVAYQNLRKALGLLEVEIELCDAVQQLASIDDDDVVARMNQATAIETGLLA
jgi:hypothetical protein